MYGYKNPATGQTQFVGDPLANRGSLQGYEYVGLQGNPGVADPLKASQPDNVTLPGQPINRLSTPATGVGAAESLLDTFRQPESEAAIAERKRKDAQAMIDSIEKIYADERMQIQERGDERLRGRNALSIFSGLAGSPEAETARGTVQKGTEKEIQANNQRKALDLAAIFSKISTEARQEAKEQQEDARRSAEESLTRQTKTRESAVNNLKLMSGSGLVDEEAFRTNPQNAEVYNHAVAALGSPDAVKAFFAFNRPQETVLASQWQGSKLFQVYQHPVTGATRSELVDLGPLGYEIPVEYTEKLDLGTEWYLYPKGQPEQGLRFKNTKRGRCAPTPEPAA